MANGLQVRRLLISALVLAASLLITLLLWNHERQNAEHDLKSKLNFSLHNASSRIEQHMAAYEQIVRGLQGFVAVSGSVHNDAFVRYVEALQLGANFSGIQRVGIVTVVPAAELPRHLATMRATGDANYKIFPTGSRESYAPIVQVESFSGRNSEVLGFDPMSSPLHYKAMQRAAESGSASVTQKIRAAGKGTESSLSDCVMYLPLYRHDRAIDTPAHRREALVGWVFAYLRVSELMASQYGEHHSEVDVSLHDSIDRSAPSLLYQSGGRTPVARAMEVTEYLSLGGATWVLTVYARPDFASTVGADQSRVILIAGTLLGALAALLCWQMLAAQGVAMALARKMTQELRNSEELARHLAQHDPLTGLPNRALFSDRLKQAISLARRDATQIALMYVDLDHFKPINDAYGHAVGDALLRAVSGRLTGVVRGSDTVGRIGGDEFVVLLPVISSHEDVQTVGNKILEALGSPFTVGQLELSVSASIGVANFPEHGNDEDSLSKSADDAMYHAKAAGRNCLRWASQSATPPWPQGVGSNRFAAYSPE